MIIYTISCGVAIPSMFYPRVRRLLRERVLLILGGAMFPRMAGDAGIVISLDAMWPISESK